MVLAVATLFAAFVSLCALTHAVAAAQSFQPALVALEDIHLVVSVLCSIVSVATAAVCIKFLPTILEIIPRFELNNEGNLDHAEKYILDILGVVRESIMVLSNDLMVVRANEASKELFGSHDMIGMSIIHRVHPDDQDLFRTLVSTAISSATSMPVTMEYRVKPLARTMLTPLPPQCVTPRSKVHCEPPSTSLSAISLQDESAGYVWVESTILKHIHSGRDESLKYTLEMVSRSIDERKKQQQSQLEHIVKKTEEQGRINSAKLRYLSCIAHDLKTPLQSFCYTLDLLSRTNLVPEQRELIQQADVSVDMMKLTISQTMDINKALTGAKLTPRRATVSLFAVLARVETNINGFGKQVPVTFEKAANVANEIVTDEEWLWQMLLNLLTNACKYTDKGSIALRVSLPHEQARQSRSPFTLLNPDKPSAFAEEGSDQDSEILLFEVIDTGVGVSSDKLPHMFDAFSQVQEDQTTGTGLGLYGVRMRAEGLQGTCGARHNTESSTGTGTVMWFAIPYLANRSRSNSEASRRSNKSPSTVREAALTDAVSPDELARRAQEVLQRSPLTAMVVEDTLTVRKLMERMLLQMGFAKVVGYDNGSKGLDAMMAGTVDIVFSDVQMPVMTGPEMASRFRKFEAKALAAGARSKRQVIVAVTANGSELRDNTNVGFDDVYPKPLSRSDIYKIINEFV